MDYHEMTSLSHSHPIKNQIDYHLIKMFIL